MCLFEENYIQFFVRNHTSNTLESIAIDFNDTTAAQTTIYLKPLISRNFKNFKLADM